MKTHHFSYIFIFLLFTIKACPAQTLQVRFNPVSGANGITLGKINCITQDRRGVMWLSDQDNHCIIRYDGTQMARLPYDPNNPNSLGGRYPECIAADSDGVIWIGFTGMGLDRFDPATNKFIHFRHQPNDTGSLASDTLSALLVDHMGNLWVGNDGGLDLFNKRTGKFKHFRHNDLDSTSLSYNVVRAIYEDHQGTIWIGTGFPWVEPVNKGGLNRFNRATGTFTRYLNDPQNPHSLINNKVRAIFEDSRGIFWVGTGGDGLHTMDRKTGKFDRYTYNPAKPHQLSRPPVVNNVGDHITFITEDALGYLWIGTFANGMNRYDAVTKKITQFGGDVDESGMFKDKSCWWSYASQEGFLWVSTQDATLYQIDLFTNIIPRCETNMGIVHSFYKETPSVLWFGTDKGLIRKDLRDGTSRHYLHEPLNPNSLSSNSVGPIIQDEQGCLWLGIYGGGINRLNPKTGVFTHFRHDPEISGSLCNDLVYAIYEDRRSNLWIATADGLDLMDRKTGKIVHYRKDPNDPGSISSNFTTSILEEGPDALWVGAYYTGLNRMNPQTGKFKHYLLSEYVTSIYKDPDGITWVGTANGLYRYNKGSDDFSFFSQENSGFRITCVTAIIGDDQNNLWTSSTSGICRINRARDQIIIYDKRNGVDGFSPQIIWGAPAYKGQGGEIYFGSASGYYAFYPDKLKMTACAPKIELTDLWLKGMAAKNATAAPLAETLSRVNDIHLKYDQNVFSLGFSAIDYGNPGDKIFSYKLENYDEDWRPSGAEERAYFFNVPPGKYVFKVKVSNSTNGSSAEKDMAVIVSPPWWKSWWAYGTGFLLLAIGIFIFDRVQRRRLIYKERQRGMFRELEMQVLRSQMNPHFIFNCLSSINNFVLKNETEEASGYLTKFSRLMRSVLNNSKKSYIPLEHELEMLGLYLEMEKLRFKDTFTYCIHMGANMEPAAIFIPPLLLQPFVENAVWHGLMHKAGPGRLNICLKVEKNILMCLIEDNGVGRSFAKELESKPVEKKRSMGIQITKQRLALMNGNAGIGENDFVIEDLFDDAGHAAGTKVLMRIKYRAFDDEIL